MRTIHRIVVLTLAVFGSGLFAAVALAAFGDDKAGQVRMAVYNVACGQWTTPERVARELEKHGLDLLGLNEMPRLIEKGSGQEWCTRLAKALEMPYVYSGTVSSANHGAPRWIDEGRWDVEGKKSLDRIFYRPNGKVRCVLNDVIRPEVRMSDHPYAMSVFQFESPKP